MPVRHCAGCGRFLPSGSAKSHKCGFTSNKNHTTVGLSDSMRHIRSEDKRVQVYQQLEQCIRKQKHYNDFKIQPAKFIGENKLDFLAGNVIKYVVRFEKKNGLEDLQKAKHYLDMLIERTEKGTVTP